MGCGISVEAARHGDKKAEFDNRAPPDLAAGRDSHAPLAFVDEPCRTKRRPRQIISPNKDVQPQSQHIAHNVQSDCDWSPQNHGSNPSHHQAHGLGPSATGAAARDTDVQSPPSTVSSTYTSPSGYSASGPSADGRAADSGSRGRGHPTGLDDATGSDAPSHSRGNPSRAGTLTSVSPSPAAAVLGARAFDVSPDASQNDDGGGHAGYRTSSVRPSYRSAGRSSSGILSHSRSSHRPGHSRGRSLSSEWGEAAMQEHDPERGHSSHRALQQHAPGLGPRTEGMRRLRLSVAGCVPGNSPCGNEAVSDASDNTGIGEGRVVEVYGGGESDSARQRLGQVEAAGSVVEYGNEDEDDRRTGKPGVSSEGREDQNDEDGDQQEQRGGDAMSGSSASAGLSLGSSGDEQEQEVDKEVGAEGGSYGSVQELAGEDEAVSTAANEGANRARQIETADEEQGREEGVLDGTDVAVVAADALDVDDSNSESAGQGVDVDVATYTDGPPRAGASAVGQEQEVPGESGGSGDEQEQGQEAGLPPSSPRRSKRPVSQAQGQGQGQGKGLHRMIRPATSPSLGLGLGTVGRDRARDGSDNCMEGGGRRGRAADEEEEDEDEEEDEVAMAMKQTAMGMSSAGSGRRRRVRRGGRGDGNGNGGGPGSRASSPTDVPVVPFGSQEARFSPVTPGWFRIFEKGQRTPARLAVEESPGSARGARSRSRSGSKRPGSSRAPGSSVARTASTAGPRSAGPRVTPGAARRFLSPAGSIASPGAHRAATRLRSGQGTGTGTGTGGKAQTTVGTDRMNAQGRSLHRARTAAAGGLSAAGRLAGGRTRQGQGHAGDSVTSAGSTRPLGRGRAESGARRQLQLAPQGEGSEYHQEEEEEEAEGEDARQAQRSGTPPTHRALIRARGAGSAPRRGSPLRGQGKSPGGVRLNGMASPGATSPSPSTPIVLRGGGGGGGGGGKGGRSRGGGPGQVPGQERGHLQGGRPQPTTAGTPGTASAQAPAAPTQPATPSTPTAGGQSGTGPVSAGSRTRLLDLIRPSPGSRSGSKSGSKAREQGQPAGGSRLGARSSGKGRKRINGGGKGRGAAGAGSVGGGDGDAADGPLQRRGGQGRAKGSRLLGERSGSTEVEQVEMAGVGVGVD